MFLPRSRVNDWRRTLYIIIFEADTRYGRWFDLALVGVILCSSLVVTLESVPSIHKQHAPLLQGMDWAFTLLFAAEYLLRLACTPKPASYARSFFGVIDLLAVLPQFMELLLPQSHFLTAIRILRLLRLFRILKLARYLNESEVLIAALRASRRKITVFLVVVLLLAMVLGTLMYVIEGEQNGFTSIPVSVYWAIVTLTTVGFGDITPKTPMGQALASLVMILGYGIIAVPTGIVSAEMVKGSEPRRRSTTRMCPNCCSEGHDWDARYCKHCSQPLPPPARDPDPATGSEH